MSLFQTNAKQEVNIQSFRTFVSKRDLPWSSQSRTWLVGVNCVQCCSDPLVLCMHLSCCNNVRHNTALPYFYWPISGNCGIIPGIFLAIVYAAITHLSILQLRWILGWIFTESGILTLNCSRIQRSRDLIGIIEILREFILKWWPFIPCFVEIFFLHCFSNLKGWLKMLDMKQTEAQNHGASNCRIWNKTDEIAGMKMQIW